MDRKQINSYIGLHTFGRSLVVFAAIMGANPTNCMASSIADNFTGRQANCCAYSRRGIMAMASLPPTRRITPTFTSSFPVDNNRFSSSLNHSLNLATSPTAFPLSHARFLKFLEDRNDIPSVEISHRLVRWP